MVEVVVMEDTEGEVALSDKMEPGTTKSFWMGNDGYTYGTGGTQTSGG